jgi:hypothetical protein
MLKTEHEQMQEKQKERRGMRLEIEALMVTASEFCFQPSDTGLFPGPRKTPNRRSPRGKVSTVQLRRVHYYALLRTKPCVMTLLWTILPLDFKAIGSFVPPKRRFVR